MYAAFLHIRFADSLAHQKFVYLEQHKTHYELLVASDVPNMRSA